MTKIELQLVKAYKEMSDHTAPECANNCRIPYGCCEPEYCELAKGFAEEYWGIKLEETQEYKEGKTKLPFMGASGCVVEPHLRISCTLHVCCINSIGIKPGDPMWTGRYFQIRNDIERLEYERYKEKTIGDC